MKWFAILLIVANIGFWTLQIRQPAPVLVNAPEPAGASRLILMQELNFDERNSLRLAAESDEGSGPASENNQERQANEDPFNLIRQPEDVVDTAQQQRLLALQGQCHLMRGQEQALNDLAERFTALDVDHWMAFEVTELPGPMMVYVPPYQTAREAAVEVSVLRSEGVDSFIIPDGELANGISVGVFGSAANAATREAELAALGYPTQIYQYTIEETVAVLNVDAVSAEVLGDEFWTQLEADFPSVERQQNSCIKVASQDNFQ